MQPITSSSPSIAAIVFRSHKQFLFVFCWSWLIFLLSFFLSPKEKYVATCFYFMLAPMTLICWPYWPRPLFSSMGFKLFCLFVSYTAASCLWSDNEFIIRHTFKIVLESVFLTLFFIAIATAQAISLAKKQQALCILLIVASCTSLLTMLVWYKQHPLSTRLHGIYAFSQLVMTAWVYGVPTILCIQRFLNSTKLVSIISYAVLAIPLCAYMLLTQSRGPLLGVAAASAFLLIYYRNRRSLALAILGIILLLVTAVILPARSYSNVSHLHIWQTAFRYAMEAPWFGHGYGSSTTLQLPSQSFGHAHNMYLETFYLQGLVGLILLLSLYVTGISRAIKFIKQPDVVGALAILIFSSICMLTDNQLLIIGPHEIWLNFWGPLFYLLSKNSGTGNTSLSENHT